MPTDMMKKVSNKCDYSMDELEEKWDEAKKQAEKQDQQDNYGYITSIFKNMLDKECLEKLGWKNEGEENMDIENKINKYLNEDTEDTEDTEEENINEAKLKKQSLIEDILLGVSRVLPNMNSLTDAIQKGIKQNKVLSDKEKKEIAENIAATLVKGKDANFGTVIRKASRQILKRY